VEYKGGNSKHSKHPSCFFKGKVIFLDLKPNFMQVILNIENPKDWISKRNSQCNFDTVLQAISMRSQPEQITEPEKIDISFDSFEKSVFLLRFKENDIHFPR
jgi:hypothetical protein